MIYLTNSFTCVIVWEWCIKLNFSLFLDLENSEFALEVHSNHGHQKARNMYSKYDKSFVMFVDLKSYVKGMLAPYQQ